MNLLNPVHDKFKWLWSSEERAGRWAPVWKSKLCCLTGPRTQTVLYCVGASRGKGPAVTVFPCRDGHTDPGGYVTKISACDFKPFPCSMWWSVRRVLGPGFLPPSQDLVPASVPNVSWSPCLQRANWKTLNHEIQDNNTCGSRKRVEAKRSV